MSRTTHVVLGIRSHVVKVDLTTGNELWRTKLKSSQFVSVYQRGESIFAGAGGELFCLSSDGSILWRNTLPRLGFGMVGFAADRDRDERDLIIGIKGRVVSINSRSGRENWRSEAFASTVESVTLLNVAERRIVAGHRGELFCLDRSTGSVLWKNRLKGLGYGLVALGGNEAAIAYAVAQAQAAARAAAAT